MSPYRHAQAPSEGQERIDWTARCPPIWPQLEHIGSVSWINNIHILFYWIFEKDFYLPLGDDDKHILILSGAEQTRAGEQISDNPLSLPLQTWWFDWYFPNDKKHCDIITMIKYSYHKMGCISCVLKKKDGISILFYREWRNRCIRCGMIILLQIKLIKRWTYYHLLTHN